MEKSDLLDKFLDYISRGRSLSEVCKKLDISDLQVMNLVYLARDMGIHIAMQKLDNDIYMMNLRDVESDDRKPYVFTTNEGNEIKFIVIADTRLGSKSQQLSILNDIYLQGNKMGYNNVLLCGNISAGLYPLTSVYSDTNFIDDSQGQVDYIAENFPYIEGMKTYVLTGKTDDMHLKSNKINIGKRISELRDDIVYLGHQSCDMFVDKVKVKVASSKLAKTYTVSYRAQQQIDSFRSEDKPDILLYGGLLQMESFNYRKVQCITVPSVCATTKEMSDKRYSNTIGAWYVTIRTNSKGELEKVHAMNSPYYVTEKEDYLKTKPIHITSEKAKVRARNKGGE